MQTVHIKCQEEVKGGREIKIQEEYIKGVWQGPPRGRILNDTWKICARGRIWVSW